jgi:LysR family glycine cleavage system transcriptional activator
MAHKLPPLPALRIFEAAGRHGGFTAAAAELGVTPSAVSHGVRALEDSLGLALFHRDPRGMRLTPAGETLLREASRAFEGLSRCIEGLTESRSRHGLAGSVAPTFATRWLLPRLPALRRRHPSLALTISTEREHVELGDGRFDFAIRMAAAPAGPAEWQLLAPVGMVPVVAPDCGLSLAEALARLPAIHVTAAQEDWAAWAALRKVGPIELSRGLRFDTIQMALDAAAEGLGVAIARLPVCAQDIAAGRVRALDAPVEGGTAYWLVTRPGLLRQREGRLLAAWLQHELQGDAMAA